MKINKIQTNGIMEELQSKLDNALLDMNGRWFIDIDLIADGEFFTKNDCLFIGMPNKTRVYLPQSMTDKIDAQYRQEKAEILANLGKLMEKYIGSEVNNEELKDILAPIQDFYAEELGTKKRITALFGAPAYILIGEDSIPAKIYIDGVPTMEFYTEDDKQHICKLQPIAPHTKYHVEHTVATNPLLSEQEKAVLHRLNTLDWVYDDNTFQARMNLVYETIFPELQTVVKDISERFDLSLKDLNLTFRTQPRPCTFGLESYAVVNASAKAMFYLNMA